MRAGVTLLCFALVGVVGCGGDGGSSGGGAGNGAQGASRSPGLRAAANPTTAQFPRPEGRTLEELAGIVNAGPQVGLATSVHTRGRSRLAFGMIGEDGRFLYGPSAVYVADSPGAQARGPYLAPADSLLTDPPFRSRTAASEEDAFAAVYQALVPFPRARRHSVLAVTRVGERLFGAPTEVAVLPPARDPIPDVGERAPAVQTDTLASAGGDVGRIDTRVPPSDMHRRSFDAVLGKRPIAVLFATPALCQSRVCGPVVDVAAQLEKDYGDRIEFIHQEVYVENRVQKGLRPSLRRFKLTTEPWLFTVRRDGRIAARLEGSFGLRAFEDALEAALR